MGKVIEIVSMAFPVACVMAPESRLWTMCFLEARWMVEKLLLTPNEGISYTCTNRIEVSELSYLRIQFVPDPRRFPL